MRLGIFGGATGSVFSPDGLVAEVAAVASAGFPSYWVSHLPWGPDALTSLALAGREVPGIELGTVVVPTWPRHPLALAQQALTTSSLVGDRLSLGVGLAHRPVVEAQWGYPFERPVRHAREYLQILGPALRNEKVSAKGETLSGRSGPLMPGAPAPRLYLAALGARMLELAGTLTDGTIVWMTGGGTIAGHTVPVITAAAEAADRPRPRVIAGFPVLCTDDEAAGRAVAARLFKVYGTLPSYRAMLDREGLAGPEDIAVIGDEVSVRDQLEAIAAAGADDIICAEFGEDGEDAARTRACLTALL